MISITMDATEVVAHFQRIGADLPIGLASAMDRIGSGLKAYIIENKLSGQVLNKVSGKLAGSESYQVDQSGNIVSVVVSANTPYAVAQEYGGAYTVPAHMSMSALGRAFAVRTHQANFTERSYQRAGLAEYTDIAIQEISDAVAGVITQ